jgi:uncharacterized protein
VNARFLSPLIGGVVLVLALGAGAMAQPEDFPPLTGRVVDSADIIGPSAERELDRKLAAWEAESADQVVVATVTSLDGYEIERYAVDLFRAWGLGVAEATDGRRLDNGVLFLVAPNERGVRIEVGYGLEPVLTDALSSQIIRQRVLPAFRENDYEGGITAGTDAILSVLSDDGAEWADRRERAASRPVAEGEGAFVWIVLFLGLLVLMLALRYRMAQDPVVFESDPQPRARRRHRGPVIMPMPFPHHHRPGGFGGGGFGGGGFGGGGFSGGGGMSGGGGASGSW